MRTPPLNRDLYAGAVLVLIGLGAVIASRGNSIGTLTHMGAGYFPIVLGLCLTGLGVAIALSSFSANGATQPEVGALRHPPDWRGVIAIVLGLLAFIIFGRLFGMAPAIFSCVFISALGDRTTTTRAAAILASCMSVFTVILFSYLLHLSFPILQW